MIHERDLEKAALAIAAKEKELGHGLDLNEQHAALTGVIEPGDQHQIIKRLSSGSVLADFYMHSARTGKYC